MDGSVHHELPPRWLDLRQQLQDILLLQPSVAVLTGSSNTAFVRLLTEALAASATVICLAPPKQDSDLAQQIAAQFNIGTAYFDSCTAAAATHKTIIKYLAKNSGRSGKPVILLCEDAEQYDAATLEQLRQLSNFPLSLLLCGEHALLKKLRRAQFAPLRQRIAAHFRLPLAAPPETAGGWRYALAIVLVVFAAGYYLQRAGLPLNDKVAQPDSASAAPALVSFKLADFPEQSVGPDAAANANAPLDHIFDSEAEAEAYSQGETSATHKSF